MFSTHLGRYAPRAGSHTAIVLRSSPEDDQEHIILKLRQRFPKECKEMTSLQPDVFKYFDHYDTHRHGSAFLQSVLTTIAMQNNKRMEYVRQFAEDWGKNNPGLFGNIMSQTPNVFTEQDREEYGCEFIADVFTELQHRKAIVLQPYKKPVILTNPSETCGFDSKPPEFIPPMNITQLQCYTPPLESQPNYIGPQVLIFSPGIMLSAHSSNDILLTQTNAPNQSQSFMNCSLNNDSEVYSSEGHRPEEISVIPAVRSQSFSESFPYHHGQPDLRHRHSMFQNPVLTSLIQNSQNIATDDTRVVEIQETIKRDQAPTRTLERSTAFQGTESSHLNHPTFPDLVLRKYPAGHPLVTDPAVMHVADWSSQTQEAISGLHVQQFHSSGPKYPAPSNLDMPKYRIGAKVYDTRMHTATESRSSYHPNNNSGALERRSSSLSQLPNRKRGGIMPKNHEHPVYTEVGWNPRGERSTISRSEYPPPPIWNTANVSFQGPQSKRTSSATRIIDENKVWVGGIPDDATEDAIKRLFENYGEVTMVKIIHGGDPEQSQRKFAFVTFERAIDAAKSIEKMQEPRLGNDIVQVRPAFEPHSRRVQYQFRNRESEYCRVPDRPMNEAPQYSNLVGRKGDTPAIWMVDRGTKTTHPPNFFFEGMNEIQRCGTNISTIPRPGNPQNYEYQITPERQSQQTPEKNSPSSCSKPDYSRQLSSARKRNENTSMDLTPSKKKFRNPSKFKRNGKLVDAPKFSLDPGQKSEWLDSVASESGHEPIPKSPHQQFFIMPSSTQISPVDLPSQDHSEPSNSVQFSIEDKEEILIADKKQPVLTSFDGGDALADLKQSLKNQENPSLTETSNMAIVQTEQIPKLATGSDPKSHPQSECLSSYTGGSQVCMDPVSILQDFLFRDDSTFREQEQSKTSVLLPDSSEFTIESSEEQSKRLESLRRPMSYDPTASSGVMDVSLEVVPETTFIASSTSPKLSTENDPDPLASRTRLRGAELLTNFERKPTVSAIAKPSAESSPCSDQIRESGVLNQRKSWTSPRSSFLVAPSTAIVTHKKKKKNFPSNDVADQLRNVPFTTKNEGLLPNDLVDQTGGVLETSNTVESPHCTAKVETMTSSLSKEENRCSRAGQESNDNLAKVDSEALVQCSISKSSQPSKAMGKRSKKSKRKGKAESEKTTSESSATLKVNSVLANSTYFRTPLPKPETPYLNDFSEAGDTVLAITLPQSEAKDLLTDELVVPSVDPQTRASFRIIILPEPETPYSVNEEHVASFINCRVEKPCIVGDENMESILIHNTGIDSSREKQPTMPNLRTSQCLDDEGIHFLRRSSSPEQEQENKASDAQRTTLADSGFGIAGYQELITSLRSCDAPLAPRVPNDQDLFVNDLDFETHNYRPQRESSQLSQEVISSQEQVVSKATPSTPILKPSEGGPCPELSSLRDTPYKPTASSPSSRTESRSGGSGHVAADSFDSTSVKAVEDSLTQEVVKCTSPQAQEFTPLPNAPSQWPRLPFSETGSPPDKTKQQSQFGSAVGPRTAGSGKEKAIAENTKNGKRGFVEENNGIIFDRAGAPARANDPWILPRGERIWGKPGKK